LGHRVSRHVVAEAEVPGVFIKIAVIAPAKVAEQYIAVSNAIAGTGSIVSVNGKSNAAPVVAFKPGNAPITTPPRVAQSNKNTKVGSVSVVKPARNGDMNYPYHKFVKTPRGNLMLNAKSNKKNTDTGTAIPMQQSLANFFSPQAMAKTVAKMPSDKNRSSGTRPTNSKIAINV
jgi:hypothetical protein